LNLLDMEPGVCAIGSWQNVTIIVWWAQANASAVRRLAQATETMRELHPERVSNVHIVNDGAGLPLPEARAGFVKIMQDYADSLGNVAVVIGGSGFWASTMRSAITGMRFISPRSFEMRLHATPSEILDWLPLAHLQRTGVTIARNTLACILDEGKSWSPQSLADTRAPRTRSE
jgi:hypothetical protein